MEPLEQLFLGLTPALGGAVVRVSGGEWTPARRLAYRSEAQAGTGRGPYREMDDWRWAARVESDEPLAGVALLGPTDRGEWWWAKSRPPQADPPIAMDFRGWLGGVPVPELSFSASFHGAYLPGPALLLDAPPPEACRLGAGLATLGNPYVVARVGALCFALLLLPASGVRTGRNRLWRLRDSLGDAVGAVARTLLTRRRNGSVRL